MRPGRNEPCPCGNGKKYKKCHLAEDEKLDAVARESSTPIVQARAAGAGRLELVVSTTGDEIPEGGHDDCPICRAKTPEERMRAWREHGTFVPWN